MTWDGDGHRRDTRLWYGNMAPEDIVSASVLAWLRQHASGRVLDLGCGTGGYGTALRRDGIEVIGADVNPDYVRAASAIGLPAVQVDPSAGLPFSARKFDVVAMVEVLEHVHRPDDLVAEAARVAGRRILVTVPDCTHLSRLSRFGVTFEHMLELDHRNFFARDSLAQLLKLPGWQLHIEPGDHVDVGMAKLAVGGIPAKILAGCHRLRIVRPKISSRLFARLDRLSGH